jgi:hypothetical protein
LAKNLFFLVLIRAIKTGAKNGEKGELPKVDRQTSF